MFPLISQSQRESRASLGKSVHFIPRRVIKQQSRACVTTALDPGVTAATSLLYVFLVVVFVCVCHSEEQAVSDRYRTCLTCRHTHTQTHKHTHTRKHQPRSDPVSVSMCDETKRTDAELPKSSAGSRPRSAVKCS